MSNLDLDFKELRLFNGSKTAAFEEFCCQLAYRNPEVPKGSKFYRYRGEGGDGGVECVWTLPDNTEWGWQAKYFFELDKTQITESFTTALANHPNLTKYYVCIPFDLTGPRKQQRKNALSQSEKFAEYTKEWQEIARSRGKEVSIIKLGKTELIDNFLNSFSTNAAGRLKFWFDKEVLDDRWFANHITSALQQAGPRYTPQLNVSVPISQVFEAFCQTFQWQEIINSIILEFDKSANHWISGFRQPDTSMGERPFPEIAKEDGLRLETLLSKIKTALKEIRGKVTSSQGWSQLIDSLTQNIQDAMPIAKLCQKAVIEDIDAEFGEGTANSITFRHFKNDIEASWPALQVDRINELVIALENLESKTTSYIFKAVGSSGLLVEGSAGTGKTHAMCDITVSRKDRGLRSILLFGEQFQHLLGLPWERMRFLLGFGSDITQSDFFSLLDVAGEVTGHPILILIDALNETFPRKFWQVNIGSLIEQIKLFPWIQICFSCRSTYLEDTLPKNKNFGLYEYNHNGFETVEFEALTEFFTFYGLELPSFPLMQPEYSNPLFLQLLCQALVAAGLRKLPEGVTGISAIINFLLQEKNEKISDALDVFSQQNLVQQALNLLIEEVIKTKENYISWARANEIVDGLKPSSDRSKSLFDQLLREGLLRSEFIEKAESNGQTDTRKEEIIYFSFERLMEHLIVKNLLNKITQEDLSKELAVGGILNYIVSDEKTVTKFMGLVEALTIQIPEKYSDLEFFEVIENNNPGLKPAIVNATLNSLIWRSTDSIGPKTEELMMQSVKQSGFFPIAFEALLSISTRPGNKLNALWFHQLFLRLSMQFRDSTLCSYFHETYEEPKSVQRLIKWTFKVDPKTIPSEIVFLWVIQLCWFCAASDRRVRDYATKGIVRIMEFHCEEWPEVIRYFYDIDDDYILERCLASAYGSLIRSGNIEALKSTAQIVFNHYFVNKLLPPNALIRDYIRSILEYAAFKGVLPEGVGVENIRPPYTSQMPLVWPQKQKIQLYKDKYRELPRLYESCMNDDFARYTVSPLLRFDQRDEEQPVHFWIFNHVLELGYLENPNLAGFDRYLINRFGQGRQRPEWAERIGKKYQWIAFYRLMGLMQDHNLLPKMRNQSILKDLQALDERNIDPTTLVKSMPSKESKAWWVPINYDFDKVATRSTNEWLAPEDFPDTAALIQVEHKDKSWIVLEANYRWDTEKPEDEEEKDQPYRLLWLHLRSYLVKKQDLNRCWKWLVKQDFGGGWMPEGADFYYGFVGEYPWAISFRTLYEVYQKENRSLTLFRHPSNRFSNNKAKLPCKMTSTACGIIANFSFDAYSEENSISLIAPSPEFFQSTKLTWDNLCNYKVENDQIAFISPQGEEAGPQALLVERNFLLDYLEKNDLALVWTVLGEKQNIGWYLPKVEKMGYAKYSRVHKLDGSVLKSSVGFTQHVIPQRFQNDTD